MSNNRSNDELLAEFERMLDGLEEENNDEENSGYSRPTPAWWYSNDDDFDIIGEDKKTTGSKEKRCDHKELIKKQLLVSYYFICKDCGEEVK